MDPIRDSVISFYIDQSQTTVGQHGGVPVEALKKGKGTKGAHDLGSFAGGSKISKNIEISHNNGSKFKSRSNQRTLLKDLMAQLAMSIAAPIPINSRVNLISVDEGHKNSQASQEQ